VVPRPVRDRPLDHAVFCAGRDEDIDDVGAAANRLGQKLGTFDDEGLFLLAGCAALEQAP